MKVDCPKFIYRGINIDLFDLIIASFEPNNGFKKSFLTMDPVSEPSWDGRKRFSYGAKFQDVAEINITLIKPDETAFDEREIRKIFAWLSGCEEDSWLDIYDDDVFLFSFLGKFIDFEQYKLDSLTVGVRLKFQSLTPWAYSKEWSFDAQSGDGRSIKIDENGILFFDTGLFYENGIVKLAQDDSEKFKINQSGTIYLDSSSELEIFNDSDDIYHDIYLDIDFQNENSTIIYVENTILNEKTIIRDLAPNEHIILKAKQFIISDIENKIFGDSFNFVWPRLAPGKNVLSFYGSNKCRIKFKFRYPIKIGDISI